jgi:hypothetical protein
LCYGFGILVRYRKYNKLENATCVFTMHKCRIYLQSWSSTYECAKDSRSLLARCVSQNLNVCSVSERLEGAICKTLSWHHHCSMYEWTS